MSGPDDARELLYRVNLAGDAVPRLLLNVPVQILMAVTEKDIWVVTDAREIWRVSKDGSASRKIAVLPDDWCHR